MWSSGKEKAMLPRTATRFRDKQTLRASTAPTTTPDAPHPMWSSADNTQQQHPPMWSSADNNTRRNTLQCGLRSRRLTGADDAQALHLKRTIGRELPSIRPPRTNLWVKRRRPRCRRHDPDLGGAAGNRILTPSLDTPHL